MRKITILGLNFTKQTRDTQWDISMSNFNNISQHLRVENLYTNFYEFFWKRGRRRRKKGGRHTVQFIRGAFKIQMSSLWKFLRRGSILLRIAKIFRRVEIRRNEVDGEKKKKRKKNLFSRIFVRLFPRITNVSTLADNYFRRMDIVTCVKWNFASIASRKPSISRFSFHEQHLPSLMIAGSPVNRMENALVLLKA